VAQRSRYTLAVIILRAGWIVPVDSPPLRDGAVAVREGRVSWVGPAREAPAGEERDLGPGVLLPGLVNAHCHLELSYLEGRLAGAGGFVGWVERLVRARGDERPDVVRSAAAAAIASVEQTGTVAVGDVSNALLHLDLLAASGLRARVFHELIGWDPAVAPRVIAAARARIASAAAVSADVAVSLAAHAPHSVSPELFLALAEDGGPVALHLAESPAERHFLQEGDGEWGGFLARRGLGHVPFAPPGLGPARYLDGLGVLRAGLLAAHCVHLDAAERALLARRGVFAVLCPRSNRNLDVGLAPVPEMLEAGVRLCLGTDSLASVPSLDLWEDVLALRRAFPSLDPAWLVRAATANGAEALGLQDVGSLRPGARASFAFAEGPRALADPHAFLLSGEARLRGLRP
jgi:cytosine/adenosine deaminase-related metal-dependent hydrolase